MDNAMTPPASNKKRKIKSFPRELANVTDEDRSRFGLALELDPNPRSKYYGTESLVAQTVTVDVDNREVVVDLKTLVVDHLRQLCKNVGAVNCGSANKFDCRKAIATYIKYQNELERKGLTASSTASRVTSTICRAVNVVFSEQFVDDFFKVNDRMSRRDHETKKTEKSFWIAVTLAHNSCVDSDTDIVDIRKTATAAGAAHDGTPNQSCNLSDSADNERNNHANDDEARSVVCGHAPEYRKNYDPFSSILNEDNDPHISDLKNDKAINLLDINQFETKAFRKKILDLFKIRRIMKENMTVSGTHDNEPWNFVESAMTKVQGFTKIAVYYFYRRCEACDGIDSVFQPFLDAAMIGDTTSLGGCSNDDSGQEDAEDDGSISTTTTSASRTTIGRKKQRRVKEEDDALNNKYSTLIDQGQMTLQHMEESANREKARFELEQESANREKARFDLEQESANREKARFDLDLKKDRFFARLEVAKAMNDYEELEKLKKEASELPK
jgi:hypothetical protein